MFYTYSYRDPRPSKNMQTVYVGKGKDRRAWNHWEKAVHGNKGFGNFLALLRQLSLAPVVTILQEFEDEAAAFVDEMRLIALYGRRDIKTGTLFNLTDGGEGFTGAVRTEEWKENIRRGNGSPEHVAASAERTRQNWANPDFRAKAVAAIRTALQDPEVIARREAGKAAFIHTDAFRETMRAATAQMWTDDGYVEKVKAAQRQAQGTPEMRNIKAKNSATTWAKTEVRAKRTKGIQAGRGTEESKNKTRRASKAMWADPAYARAQTARNQEISRRPEVLAARVAATKAMWADPEKRARMLEARAAKKTTSKLTTPVLQ